MIGYPAAVWLREGFGPNSSCPISLLAASPVLEGEADAHLVDCVSFVFVIEFVFLKVKLMLTLSSRSLLFSTEKTKTERGREESE